MAWAALIPAAISAASAIIGGINKRKAERERQRLAATRPELQGSEFIDEQIDLSRSELARGINTPAQVAAQQNLDANFSSSLDAILRGGGSPSNVADLLGQQSIGQMRLAMIQDDIRRNNIQNLMRAGQVGEQFRQQQYSQNQWAPWADNVQAASAALQGANQQMWSGIASAGSGIANVFGSLETNQNYNNSTNGKWR